MEQDIRLKYDSLCYATMLNIRTKTSGADRVVLRNFDYGNKEHQFVLAVAMACWSILGSRELAIDDNMFARRRLNKKYSKTCKIKAAKDDEQIYVDVDELLEFMRGHACNLCGENFTFGDIYDMYYSGKDEQ